VTAPGMLAPTATRKVGLPVLKAFRERCSAYMHRPRWQQFIEPVCKNATPPEADRILFHPHHEEGAWKRSDYRRAPSFHVFCSVSGHRNEKRGMDFYGAFPDRRFYTGSITSGLAAGVGSEAIPAAGRRRPIGSSAV
jgi:hypothetical protein